jgi:hypothetical protein
VHRFQHLGKARHAVARLRRKVGAAVERLPVGREKHRHRPAAVLGERLHRLHIDRVDVGPLLAIDLDIDEIAIHDRGGGLVLEAFALHDVTPMTGAIAHAQQDRPVFGTGFRQRFLAPGIPVHRVVGVLPQVGTGFVDQTIGMLVFGHYALPLDSQSG